MEWQELRSIGLAASIEARQVFDPERGVKQATLELTYARNAMFDGIRRSKRRADRELLSETPEDFLESSDDGREQKFRDAVQSLSRSAQLLIQLIDEELVQQINDSSGIITERALVDWARERIGWPAPETLRVRREIKDALVRL